MLSKPQANAEGVADGFAAPEGVKIGSDVVSVYALVVRQPVDNHLGIAHAIELGAVAGGKDNGFGCGVHAQIAHGFGQRSGGKGKLLADG